jgi:acylphosphatase
MLALLRFSDAPTPRTLGQAKPDPRFPTRSGSEVIGHDFLGTASMIAAYVRVSGKVQGVGFRNFAEERATSLGLCGYARNLPDGRVEIEVEGEKEKVDAFLDMIREGPSRSNVVSVDVSWRPAVSKATGFSIRV